MVQSSRRFKFCPLFGMPRFAVSSGYPRMDRHLKRVAISCSGMSDVPRGPLADLVQIISVLPTSLEDLSITYGQAKEEPLKDAISSLFRRFGSSLRRFCSNVPLSEAAIHHLMQLPNIRFWVVGQGPPWAVPPSIFPSL